MITRAIVEQVIDSFHVKIRVPSIDRVQSSNLHTSTENLNTATYAGVPGCEVNLQPGDVVIVHIGAEDATILGYLYRNESINKRSSFNLESLNVSDTVNLPFQTSIGDVTSNDISKLVGVKDNIQYQIDILKKEIETLKTFVKEK